jgi:3-methyl-2-oxobutanoate hydroxymethyltransferase
MSKQTKINKITAPSLMARKQQAKILGTSEKLSNPRITVLTVYDYTTAKVMDSADCIDCFLVGDSLGMVMLGYNTTVQVTMADMLHHTKAVRRGTQKALLIADMPFGSTTTSEEKALENIQLMMQCGQADAVKIEGATAHLLNVIQKATEHGVPVMGHLGLTPQSVNQTGGYSVQGKTLPDVSKLIEDALALQKAGVFALVLEMVPTEVAELVSLLLDIPTIGIGAGQYCDGQVLVVDDMLGKFTDLSPKFVRQYLQLSTELPQAFQKFATDVRTQKFPSAQEQFYFPKPHINELAELALSYGIELESLSAQAIAPTTYANA